MQNRGKAMHLEQENGLKPHFGPLVALFGPILGPTKFFQHVKNHQVLDIIILNHNMQNCQKLMIFEEENGLKPHFGPFLALNGPFLAHQIFFSKIGLRHFSRLIRG